MHEVSFGQTIRDYITGEEIEETTYEEFRQALARMLVEEKGYPVDRLRSKVDIAYSVDGEDHTRTIDVVVLGAESEPLMLVMFCAGEVGSYEREAVSAGRLIKGGPAPFAVVTDTRGASLMDVKANQCLRTGMAAIPHWDELVSMAGSRDIPQLDPERRAREERVFHTYSGFLFGTCCSDSCGTR